MNATEDKPDPALPPLIAVVVEKEEEALTWIDRYCRGDFITDTSVQRVRDAALTRLRTVLDSYLECPTLLDAHIEKWVRSLADQVLVRIKTKTKMSVFPPPHPQNTSNKPSSLSSSFALCDPDDTNDEQQQQQQQQNIILSMRYFLSALYALSKVRGRKVVARFLPTAVDDVEPLWRLFMTEHQASVIIHTESAEAATEITTTTMTQPPPPPVWESLYMLWIWMSVLALVPFHASVWTANDARLIESLRDAATQPGHGLSSAGPVRTAAAVGWAQWLSKRPEDLHLRNHSYLSQFVNWTRTTVLEQFLIHPRCGHPLPPHPTSYLLQMMGAMQTLNHVLKHASMDRTILVQHLIPLWEPLLQLQTTLSQPNQNSHNLLLHKLLCKWWTRMSCVHLSPRPRPRPTPRRVMNPEETSCNNAQDNDSDSDCDSDSDSDSEWPEISDVVEQGVGRLLESLRHSSTVVRWSASKGIGRVADRLPTLCTQDILDAIFADWNHGNVVNHHHYHPISSHPATISWSDDTRWHGTCLALAELVRRRLLRPRQLRKVVPWIVHAIHYDGVRSGGATTTGVGVGAHVRDAACYTVWAIGRAYAPKTLQPHCLRDLTHAMLCTALFDREVNCRRAASAAFQEAVGRQGAHHFPHGIDILTQADFVSLGNRVNAYTTIAKAIAHYEPYRIPILRHLYRVKLSHWDPVIRQLSATSLSLLTKLDPVFMGSEVLPYLLEQSLDPHSLPSRHGAVLGVAEITLSLIVTAETTTTTTTTTIHAPKSRSLPTANLNASLLSTYISPATQQALVSLVSTIDQRRLFRGRGSELMRTATCRLVECISRSSGMIMMIPLSVPEQVHYLDCIDDCIVHPMENVQRCACSALEQLMTTYFPVRRETGPTPRLQARVVDKFIQQVNRSDNPAATRGYALALGHLPGKLLAPNHAVLNSVLKCLCNASRFDALVGGESDAETRRNALESLRRIAETVRIVGCYDEGTRQPLIDHDHTSDSKSLSFASHHSKVQLTLDQVRVLVDAYLLGLRDYRSDKRGDVGGWCRMAALDGLTSLVEIVSLDTLLLSSSSYTDTSRFISSSHLTLIIAAALRQLSEPLDSVRQKAGECLTRILCSSCGRNSLAHSALVRALLDTNPNDLLVTHQPQLPWGEPEFVFPRVLKASSDAKVDEYYAAVMTGVAVSVGGLTKSVSVAASSALIEWLQQSCVADGYDGNKLGDHLLDELQSAYLHNRASCSRITLPLLKTIRLLLECKLLCYHKYHPVEFRYRFVLRCLDVLVEIQRNCDDVHRLHALVDTSVCLWDILDPKSISSSHTRQCISTMAINNTTTSEEDEYRMSGFILSFMCLLLRHKYPRVRAYTAEQLYVLLLSSDDIGNDATTLQDREDHTHHYYGRETSAVHLVRETPWSSTVERSLCQSNLQLIIHSLRIQPYYDTFIDRLKQTQKSQVVVHKNYSFKTQDDNSVVLQRPMAITTEIASHVDLR